MDTEPLVEFIVRGAPQSRGSKTAFVLYRDPKTKKVPVRRPDGSIVVNMADSNPKSKGWMEQVELEARLAWGRPALPDVALTVDLTFFMKRPGSHFGSGRNARLVKDSAPARPITQPDLDKMTRGTVDALTGVVWKDDAQVVRLTLDKAYAVPRGPEDDGQGVLVRVGRSALQTAAQLEWPDRTRWIESADAPPDSLLV